MIRVTVNGTTREVEPGTTAAEVLADRSALAARVDGRLVDLSSPLEADATVEPVRFDSEQGRDLFWHSASHLMAQAVKQLYPTARVTIGPAVPEGFYYDFDVEPPFTEADLERIEDRMRELAAEKIPVVHRWLSRESALKLFSDRGETYKSEIVSELPDERISVYEQGDFVDLCRGPHVPNTGYLKAVKLLSVAGAYWHADEKNRMLSRVYGVAFPSRELLKEHLALLEEAKRRDHRKLGPALDLFSFHEEAGAGLAFWHPKGATVRRLIQQYWEQEHLAAGYQLVLTPHIARAGLWQTSGHLDYYSENMYLMDVEQEQYVLKPMNCPGHMLIYRTKVHSYRDLPLRMGEWGTVYRRERSGVLHGMMRVRGFTQDDAHIFCTPEQVEDEAFGVVSLAVKMLRAFGFEKIKVDLSVRDPRHRDKYLGTDEQWQLGEQALVRALERTGLPYRRAEGEAVFYGPKIDIKLLDSLGREWQCPTCQFDFNEGPRFNLYYMGPDGRHHPVYLVHRTVLGGIERFMGILVEHYAGAFPTWLAPVQVRVLSVTDAEAAYATATADRLRAEGVRVETDTRSDKISLKISEAERQKIPFMFVVGGREAQSGAVALRRHGRGNLGALPFAAALAQVKEESNVPGS
ncbi:threonine--tRNA ligase [candidate division WOR-3 bacterium]|nr:threonine--tRNA ligase [candidate division WOR-3 bacterium]